MIVITTNNSTSVKPCCRHARFMLLLSACLIAGNSLQIQAATFAPNRRMSRYCQARKLVSLQYFLGVTATRRHSADLVNRLLSNAGQQRHDRIAAQPLGQLIEHPHEATFRSDACRPRTLFYPHAGRMQAKRRKTAAVCRKTWLRRPEPSATMTQNGLRDSGQKGDRSNLCDSTLRAVPANWTCPHFPRSDPRELSVAPLRLATLDNPPISKKSARPLIRGGCEPVAAT